MCIFQIVALRVAGKVTNYNEARVHIIPSYIIKIKINLVKLRAMFIIICSKVLQSSNRQIESSI